MYGLSYSEDETLLKGASHGLPMLLEKRFVNSLALSYILVLSPLSEQSAFSLIHFHPYKRCTEGTTCPSRASYLAASLTIGFDKSLPTLIDRHGNTHLIA